jgi:predicted nucleotidyltransferase
MKKVKGYKKQYMKIIKEFKTLCLNHYKDMLISLVVFGSVAKGSFSPVSDIDLLIILRNKREQYEEYSDYYDHVESKLSLIKDFPVEINPIFKSYEELSVKIPYLWITEFLILYDREDFFKKFLNKLEHYKESSLVIHNQHMQYIELLNGQ